MADRSLHITNLESDELIAKWLAEAEAEKAAKPADKLALAKHSHAQDLMAGHIRTWDFIRKEHGDVVIGKPMKTRYKSSDTLAKQGYVGIYRRG